MDKRRIEVLRNAALPEVDECLDEIERLQSKFDELESAWGDDLIESYNVYLKEQKMAESLREEQKLLAFAIEHYPTMWLGSYPKLKGSLAERMHEEKKDRP